MVPELLPPSDEVLLQRSCFKGKGQSYTINITLAYRSASLYKSANTPPHTPSKHPPAFPHRTINLGLQTSSSQPAHGGSPPCPGLGSSPQFPFAPQILVVLTIKV